MCASDRVLSHTGSIDACWSPSNFTGWSVSAAVVGAAADSALVWNFTIGLSPSLQQNVSNMLSKY